MIKPIKPNKVPQMDKERKDDGRIQSHSLSHNAGSEIQVLYALHDAKDENSRSEDQPKVFSGLRSFEETQQDHRDDTDRLHIRNEVEETDE